MKNQNENTKILTDLGFNETQTHAIILKHNFKELMNSIQQCMPNLLNAPYFYDHQEITKIITTHNGPENLLAIFHNFSQLQCLGLDKFDICKITKRNDGPTTLQSILTNYQALKTFDLTTKEIIQLASFNYASRILSTLKDNFTRLIELGFSKAQILAIATHQSGASNIESLIHFTQRENNYPQLSHVEWVSLIGSNRGIKYVQLFRKYYALSSQPYFYRQEMIDLLTLDTSNSIEENKKILQEMIEWGLNIDQILQMTSLFEGTTRLNDAYIYLNQLLSVDITIEKIFQMLANPKTIEYLNAVQEYFHLLQTGGFTHEQFFKILETAGEIALKEITDKHDAIESIPLNSEQITEITSYPNGHKNLNALLITFESLQNLGFTLSELLKIASHPHGYKNLRDTLNSFIDFLNLGFTRESFIEIAEKDENRVIKSYYTLTKLGFCPEQMINVLINNQDDYDPIEFENAFKYLLQLDYMPQSIIDTAQEINGVRDILKLCTIHQKIDELDELMDIFHLEVDSIHLQSQSMFASNIGSKRKQDEIHYSFSGCMGLTAQDISNTF
jgi:hypothetical protein